MTEKRMYGGRVVDGGMQTAVQEYLHPGGRSILLIGCVHMAEPDYFVNIRKIVDEAESSGATVYMEGTSFRVAHPNATEEELTAIRASRDALNKQYSDLPELLDLPWIYQGQSALAPYPSTWMRSDAREIDMCRLIGPKNAVGLAPSVQKYEWFRHLKETKGADSVAYLHARGKLARSYIWQFKELPKMYALYSRAVLRISQTIGRIVRLFSGKAAPVSNIWMKPYIFTYRESIAALTALAAEDNVAMLWHPGHMIGIGQILMRNGFEPQEPIRWLTACHKVEPTSAAKPNAQKRPPTTGVEIG